MCCKYLKRKTELEIQSGELQTESKGVDTAEKWNYTILHIV